MKRSRYVLQMLLVVVGNQYCAVAPAQIVSTPIVSTPAISSPVVSAPVVNAAPMAQPITVQPVITPLSSSAPTNAAPVVTQPVMQSAMPNPVMAPTVNVIQPVASVQQPLGSKTIVSVTEKKKSSAESSADIKKEQVADGIPNELAKELEEGRLDTMNLPVNGNWLLKRVWWEKTEDVYEQIKDVVAKIVGMQQNFVRQENDFEKNKDIFISEMGADERELHSSILFAKDILDKEKIQGILTEAEKAFVAKVAGKEHELDQLDADVKMISEIENKIEEAVSVFFEQVEVVNKYEQKAWENFKNIARELDDQEARTAYYNTKTLLDDTKKILDYLSKDFNAYFASVISTGHDQIQKISGQLNTFKATGLDLKKEAESLQEQKKGEVIKKQTEDREKAIAKKKEEDKNKKEAEEKAHWYYPIKKAYNSTAVYVISLCSHLSFIGDYLSPVKKTIGSGWEYIKSLFLLIYDGILSLFNKSKPAEVSVKNKKDDKKDVKDSKESTPDISQKKETESIHALDVKNDVKKTPAVPEKNETSSAAPRASLEDKKEDAPQDTVKDYYDISIDAVKPENLDVSYYGINK